MKKIKKIVDKIGKYAPKKFPKKLLFGNLSESNLNIRKQQLDEYFIEILTQSLVSIEVKKRNYFQEYYQIFMSL
jgi:hypothetical protein